MPIEPRILTKPEVEKLAAEVQNKGQKAMIIAVTGIDTPDEAVLWNNILRLIMSHELLRAKVEENNGKHGQS